jgi:hypothetical protein
MNPIRWVRDLFSFIRWYRSMTRKDERGRISGFLYKADDAAKKDYLDGRPFGRRVFVSFARESLTLAEAFEDALRSVGLEPWRYQPSDDQPNAKLPPKSGDNYLAQLDRFEHDYPEAAERIEATIRRCTAVVFLISDASLRSAICEVEAWAASIIHGPAQKDAAVYVILDRADLSPPAFLANFWRRVYEPGLEGAMAQVIASEIEGREIRLRLIEEYRAKIYR